MASSVYVETTIVSYLTARPSRDLVQRAHQQLTRRWWRMRRPRFDLYVSPLVIQEAAGGDSLRARRRLAALKAVPVLEATSDAMRLAEALAQAGAIPAQAVVDATHIAIATVHGMDYLLTWNCAHIANAAMSPDRNHLPKRGLRTVGFMYARRTYGGLKLWRRTKLSKKCGAFVSGMPHGSITT